MRSGILSAIVRSRVAGMLTEARALQGVEHDGLRGHFRELLLANILTDLLPPTCAAVRGTTIDVDNRRSDERLDGQPLKTEDDILIVDRETLPGLFYSTTDGVFPLESVLARIEVKSRLSAAELTDAVIGAQQFGQLGFDRTDVVDGATLQYLFAFDTDLKAGGKSEIVRFREVLENRGGDFLNPPLLSICVVGRGTWALVRFEKGAALWTECLADGEHTEVLTQLGVLMNSLPDIREKRRTARLGSHIVNKADLRVLPPSELEVKK